MRMKLFIITCLKEYQAEVIKIFKQAEISAFSITDVTGFKGNQMPDLLDDWFASGDEKFDSLVIFSFTNAANSANAIELINSYNKETETKFPIRAFIVPVEKSNL